jgi:hypothetical protein
MEFVDFTIARKRFEIFLELESIWEIINPFVYFQIIGVKTKINVQMFNYIVDEQQK